MAKDNIINKWVMTLFIFGVLLALGFVLGMVFPGLEGASWTILGTTLNLGGVSLVLAILAFLIAWIMSVSLPATTKAQSEGIMTAIVGLLVAVFASAIGEVHFIIGILALAIKYVAVILFGAGFGRAVAASTNQAANTISFGMVGKQPRKRKRK